MRAAQRRGIRSRATFALSPDDPGDDPGNAPDDEPGDAAEEHAEDTRRRLGDILVARGNVSEAAVHEMLTEQRLHRDDDPETRLRLGAMLVQHRLASEEQVASALGELLGREVVDATHIPLDPGWARRMSRSVCERSQVLVIGDGPRGLRVLSADPTDVMALDDVRRETGSQRLDILIATPTQLRGLIDRVWSIEQSGVDAADVVVQQSTPDDDELGATTTTDAPTVRLLDSILADAVRSRASDVHIEQQKDSVRIRYRVDGLMREVMSLPRALGRMLTARVKVVAGMDIAERRVPQDGRTRLTVDGRPVDARVSTLPAMHGEKAVIRLLPGAGSIQPLESLGLAPEQEAALSEALRAPQGLVLITGPTGSGKTNTLYAAIAATITPERNVVTLEDPVEIELPGITQVPVDEKTGMTFARGLRALLRQDPDVVLVGEVRDTVTAELAMRAALTGHLVLTTLHTNSAAAALPRLVDMGVEPYLVASSLSLVVAQRLHRLPCDFCAEPYEPDPALLVALGLDAEADRPEPGAARRGRGCQTCAGTGYYGRRGLFETLEITSEIRRALLAGTDEAAVLDLAGRNGFRTMRDRGVEIAALGETSYEEILRVTRAGL